MKHLRTIAMVWLVGAMIGCGGKGNAPTNNNDGRVATNEPDDPKAIEALGSLAKELKRDGGGFVTQADFRGAEIGDDALSHLAELQRLSILLLNNTGVTDDGMAAVGKIMTLRNLDLRECKLSNAALGHLTGLTNLVALKLSGKDVPCTVDDEGLTSIAKLTGLRALALDYLLVSVDGLSKLDQLKSLEELYVGGRTLIDDDAVAKLPELFPRLKKLRISQSRVTADGLQHLVMLKQLEELDLSECSQLDNEALAYLADMPQLKRLNLWRINGVNDEGVAHLAGLTKMVWLNLDNTQLSDGGMMHLAGMKELTFLHLGSTAITDAGIDHLEGLTKLEDLKVTRTAVTERRAAELKKKLPNTEIQLIYIEGE